MWRVSLAFALAGLGGLARAEDWPHWRGPQRDGLSRETGKAAYVANGVGKGSVTYADGMLYTYSERGAMGLVPATPTGHNVVSRFRVPPGGSGPFWAHPVVSGGRLYLRHADALHCYDIARH